MESFEGERSKNQSQELCFWFLFHSSQPRRSARPDLEAPLRLFAALHMKWSDWNIVSLSSYIFFVLLFSLLDISPFFFSFVLLSIFLYCFVC